MNIFVLCTGRCGSVTFAKACGFLTNFTAGHETRWRLNRPERFQYPDQHIEVDNRLAWFLGSLDRIYGDNAHYVHLTRDPEEVALSYARRWDHRGTIIRAFGTGIVPALEPDPLLMARDMVSTVTENIELFLRDKTRVSRVRLESAQEDFGEFLGRIDAEGDIAGSIAQWDIVYNPSRPVAADTNGGDGAEKV